MLSLCTTIRSCSVGPSGKHLEFHLALVHPSPSTTLASVQEVLLLGEPCGDLRFSLNHQTDATSLFAPAPALTSGNIAGVPSKPASGIGKTPKHIGLWIVCWVHCKKSLAVANVSC